MEAIRNTPMFFIVGRPRTGSTLLRTLFDAHPNVCIPQEWPMLLALYRRFGHITVWDKKKLLEFYEALFQKLRISYWEITNWPGFNAGELRESILACEGNTGFGELFKLVYAHYHSYFDKKEILLIGDKNPVYSNQVDLLAEIFPDAKFIHLTRDYRDNLVSMLDVDFEMPNVALLAYRWKYSFRKIEDVASQYPDRFITLRYEDLVTNATHVFKELCSFLSIPWEPSIFRFHERREEIGQRLPEAIINRYFKSLFNPIDQSKVGVYKKRLSKFQVQIADQVVGSLAEEAGYVRDSRRFSLVVFLWSTPAIIYAKWLYLLGYLVALLPYKTMMWLLNKPSVLVKWYSRLFHKQ